MTVFTPKSSSSVYKQTSEEEVSGRVALQFSCLWEAGMHRIHSKKGNRSNSPLTNCLKEVNQLIFVKMLYSQGQLGLAAPRLK